MELDAAVLDAKPLDGSFIFDEGHDDLSRASGRLSAHDDEVLGIDARAPHALALHPKREEIASFFLGFHGNVSIQIFDGGRKSSRLHTSQDRHELGSSDTLELGKHEAAGLAGTLRQTAFLNEDFEMGACRFHGLETKGALHLSNRGGAPFQQPLADVAKDTRSRLSGRCLGHGSNIPDKYLVCQERTKTGENYLRISRAMSGKDEPTEQTVVQDEAERLRSKDRSSFLSRPEVPGYEVETLLGAGSYGEVWLALQKNTGRKVAIKFFSRFKGLDWPLLQREVGKLVEVLSERRVVHLLQVGWDADPPYYVMEYLAGGSLADKIAERPLPAKDAVRVFRDVAEALVYLHGKAILHCDLKPANVLLDDRNQIRLADFGQARLSSEEGPAIGTLFYMAPEQTETGRDPTSARTSIRSVLSSIRCSLGSLPTQRRRRAIGSRAAARPRNGSRAIASSSRRLPLRRRTIVAKTSIARLPRSSTDA